MILKEIHEKWTYKDGCDLIVFDKIEEYHKYVEHQGGVYRVRLSGEANLEDTLSIRLAHAEVFMIFANDVDDLCVLI